MSRRVLFLWIVGQSFAFFGVTSRAAGREALPSRNFFIFESDLASNSSIIHSKNHLNDWVALIKKKDGGYALVKTDLILVDGAEDADGQKTFDVRPSVPVRDARVIFFVKSPDISPRKSIKVEDFSNFYTKRDEVGDHLFFFKNKIPSGVPDYFWKLKSKPFELYMQGPKRTSALAVKFDGQFNVERTEPLFILSGDFNGDGIPDIVLDETQKDSVTDYRLHLSKKRKSKVKFEQIESEGNGVEC